MMYLYTYLESFVRASDQAAYLFVKLFKYRFIFSYAFGAVGNVHRKIFSVRMSFIKGF